MRDLFKILIGILILLSPQAYAENFKLLVIPDNIATETVAVDSYIYNASSEFFADEIVKLLNTTDYIKAPTVSEIRYGLKQDASAMITAKNATAKFKTTYNIDYVALKKMAPKTNSRYALLITSYIDSENYILRRTLWDFLNIPGATVIDPAYKISTYAVLVDTQNNAKLWADTYYKTISVCENRIITRGPSPQTEQLQKIKDYSNEICPKIVQNVQKNMLPEDIYAKESTQVKYGIGNIDNVFTKKAREYGNNTNHIYNQTKDGCTNFVVNTKEKIDTAKQERNARKLEKEQTKLESKLEVKATPVYETDTKKTEENGFKGINFKKNTKKDTTSIEDPDNSYYENLLDGIDIKKKKKNNLLYGETPLNQPELRNYEG